MASPSAIVREPGPSFVRAISGHPQRESIDLELARKQHRLYVKALRSAGAKIIHIEPLEQFPDGPFVEDTFVILKNRAVRCRMKETSRRGEAESVTPILQKHFPIDTLPPSATLDGGDVLDTGEKLFVGLSSRTNQEGVNALSSLAGKPVVPVNVLRGLHLKSSVSYLGGDRVVIDPSGVDVSVFEGLETIVVREKERYAANCLALWHTVLMPAGFSRLAAEIRRRGLKVLELDMSEFEKADGGVTCISLIIPGVPA